MSASTAASLLALRDADPANDVDTAALAPSWDSVLALIETGREPAFDAPAARPGRPARRWGLAAVAAVVVAAVVAAGVIGWPWSGGGPGSVAYGVTRQSDGTVTVRVSLTDPFTAADLQARLRAAGVSAVVLNQSPAGSCTEPLPPSVAPTGKVLFYPDNINRAEGFAIRPTAIPAGAYLVIGLTPPGINAPTPEARAFGGIFVTTAPPSCIALAGEVPTSVPSK